MKKRILVFFWLVALSVLGEAPRVFSDAETNKRRHEVRPVPACPQKAEDEGQILCWNGWHNELIQMKLQPDGSSKGRGWTYRTMSESDMRPGLATEYYCEAAKWVSHDTVPTITCVGSTVHPGGSLGRTEPYVVPGSFAIGPCLEKDKDKGFCAITAEPEDFIPSNQGLDPVVEMYYAKKIDFSKFKQPRSVHSFDKCLMWGSLSVLMGGPQVLESEPAPQEDPKNGEVPKIGWEIVALDRDTKIGKDPVAKKLLSDLTGTCGWVRYSALRRPKDNRMFVAFGAYGMWSGLADRAPQAVRNAHGIAEYLESENEFLVHRHIDEELETKRYSYRDFVCNLMCYTDVGDPSKYTDPLHCRGPKLEAEEEPKKTRQVKKNK